MISLAKLRLSACDTSRLSSDTSEEYSEGEAPTSARAPRKPKRPSRNRRKARDAAKRKPRAMTKNNGAPDNPLDQYYTRPEVAEYFYDIFCQHFDPTQYQMVEPSAGTGSFFKLLPSGSIGYDLEPKYPGIVTADFLTVEIVSDRPVAIIGNPPFGKNACMAVRFFNRAALSADVIAMIVPRSFCKAAIENRLDQAFRLLREEVVPDNAFLSRGQPFNVTTVFQIWERGSEPRQLRCVETRHPDFDFTTPDRAHVAIQRVGARAGRIHHDFTRSPTSNYFIWSNVDFGLRSVERTMRGLDLKQFVGNVASNPSLSKSEIISLYRAAILPLGGI